MKYLVLLLVGIKIINSHYQSTEQNLKLQITEPESLARLFMHNKMDYTVGDMGVIPYDTSLNGHLQQAIPIQGCEVYQNSERSPIYLVSRGNCSFGQKQKYAQMAGAKLLIVTDNKYESEDEVLMSPDDHNTDYQVPLIMISKYDGNLIIPYLTSGKQNDIVNINVQFPRMQQELYSNIDLWVSSNDYLSLEIAEDLQNTYDYEFVLDNKVIMSIHYVYYFCMSCQKTNYMQPYKDCLCGGRYCFSVVDSDDIDQNINGVDIVMENLKQSQLHTEDYVQYVTYIQKYRQNCFKDKKLIPNFRQCGEEQDKYVDPVVMNKVKQSIDNSYSNPNDIHGRGDNTIMDYSRQVMKKFDIISYPLALINGQEYKGIFHGQHMIKTICQSFKIDILPEHCKDYIYTKDHYQNMMNSTISNFPYFKFTILLLLILGIYLFFYRRSLKQEMKTEMNLQVSSAISQYHALGDTQQRL